MLAHVRPLWTGRSRTAGGDASRSAPAAALPLHRFARGLDVLRDGGYYEFQVGDHVFPCDGGYLIFAQARGCPSFQCRVRAGWIQITITPPGFERFFEEDAHIEGATVAMGGWWRWRRVRRRYPRPPPSRRPVRYAIMSPQLLVSWSRCVAGAQGRVYPFDRAAAFSERPERRAGNRPERAGRGLPPAHAARTGEDRLPRAGGSHSATWRAPSARLSTASAAAGLGPPRSNPNDVIQGLGSAPSSGHARSAPGAAAPRRGRVPAATCLPSTPRHGPMPTPFRCLAGVADCRTWDDPS